MGENSKIEWTDHTFNPWIGCTKVSPGCANCYAERMMDHRMGKVSWGGSRQRTSRSYWRQPVRWDREAAAAGVRRRVFCASLADVFDIHPSITSGWVGDLWHLISITPNLDWLLLTKRPQNILGMLPDGYGMPAWGTGWSNVWIGTTVENQATANERIPALLQVPARVRFLSCEPLLGPVDLRHVGQYTDGRPVIDALNGVKTSGNMARAPDQCSIGVSVTFDGPTIQWIIAGGESGPKARPMHPDWVRSIREQAQICGVPFLFKQWGEWAPGECIDGPPTRTEETADWSDPVWIYDKLTPGQHDGMHADDEPDLYRVGKAQAGRHLDGRTWDEVPT